MKLKIKLFTLMAVVSSQFYAQTTTVAPFLNIVTDARSAAMGDVGVATTADGNSIFHNGAKMVFHKSEGSLAVNYTPWLRQLTDDIYIWNATYQQRIDERSAFGIGFRNFNYGEIEITQEGNSGSGSNPTANPYEFSIDGAYALKLSDNYSMSVALRYTRSDLSITGTNITDIEPTNGFAVDISGYYQSNEKAYDQFNGVFRGGFAITNLGPKVDVVGREEFLPTNLKLGGGFDFIFDDYNQVGVTLEFSKLLVPSVNGEDENFISGALKSFGDSDNELQEITVGLGAEYLYNEAFAFRAGYFKEHEDAGNRNFLTFGAGFKASSFKVDVSYLMSNSVVNNPLDRTLRFSLAWDFGDTFEF